MRSNKWDHLPSTINDFKNKMQAHKAALNTIIQKSDMEDKESLNDAILAFNSVKDTAGNIYDQFLSLRNDFNNGLINQAKYRDNLKHLATLLTSTDEKIMVTELHASEIADECKKYLSGI